MALKLVHIGVGGRGRHWLDFIAGREDVKSVACVDVDVDALKAVAEKTGCATFTSIPEALGKVEADGVLIASPSFLHGPQAIQALEAEFPVMVEKPLAADLAEAVSVVARARERNLPLMVAENYRFFRAERTVRHLLDQRAIGAVQSAICVDRRDQPSRVQGAWVKKMEQPFLTEIAVHHFDSFRYLFNARPTGLWAGTHNPRGSDYERNGAAEALLEMSGGERIQYSGSFVGSRYQFYLRIVGESGEIETDRSGVQMRRAGEHKFKPVDPVAMPEGEPLRYPHAGMLSMLRQFEAAIRGGPEPETSGRDNLWTLAMFEAACKSAASGARIAIDEVFTADMRRRAGVAP